MKINAPLNLNLRETKCFNEIVKPQLEELYSYAYEKFEFENVEIFISKKEFPDNIKKPTPDEIKNILNKIPKKDLVFVSDIYFVSYHCKDETENYLVRGRTLPLVHKILIYPRAHEKLNIILAHEIGHIVFEKKFDNKKRAIFINELIKTFPQITLHIFKPGFFSEHFADCYDNFINNKERLKEFQFLYNFFIEHVK